MYILGINAFHADSSACIFKDGELIAAIEEERIKRIKHWAGFPMDSIRFCLKEAGISIQDVDHITIGRNPGANIVKKIIHVFKNQIHISKITDRFMNSRKVGKIQAILSAEFKLPETNIRAQVHNIEHHRSHLASAFFASPFNKSALLSVDGFGDFSSTMVGIGSTNRIEVLGQVTFPHSIGIFYTTLTQFLGFTKYGDEYKVMGLAPYGKPIYIDKLKEIIRTTDDGFFKLNLNYFRHVKEGVEMSWEGGEPAIGNLFTDEITKLLGQPRKKESELTQYHKDIAASVQRITEKTIFHILNHLHRRTNSDTVCIAGGVAQNSVANGKIYKETPFRKVYVPPAGQDAGIAIGSALYLWNHLLGKPRNLPMQSAATGSKFSNDEIEKILQKQNVSYLKYTDTELYDKVTNCIIDGGVVGWFQGRAEFGPRALGHRSIIADPRRADAKELLNLKIKKRESFRPFAPSILKEFTGDYFEMTEDVPFMEKVFLIKEEKRKIIPAVTHVDGTGRLQTVDTVSEPRYYKLIAEFYRKTRVPVLLNTSFNENEPIVNSPLEALDCYLRTKMDMLVLENIVIERK